MSADSLARANAIERMSPADALRATAGAGEAGPRRRPQCRASRKGSVAGGEPVPCDDGGGHPRGRCR